MDAVLSHAVLSFDIHEQLELLTILGRTAQHTVLPGAIRRSDVFVLISCFISLAPALNGSSAFQSLQRFLRMAHGDDFARYTEVSQTGRTHTKQR